MHSSIAAEFLDTQLSYKPDWYFSAEAEGENAVYFGMTFPAFNSNQRLMEARMRVSIRPSVGFLLNVGGCRNTLDLMRLVIAAIMKVEEHEAREFLRLKGSYEAPFHPHKPEGMLAWGDELQDLDYGRASLAIT